MSPSTLTSLLVLFFAVIGAKGRRITAVWLSRNALTWDSINNTTVYATLRDAGNLLLDNQTATTNAFGEFTLSLPLRSSHTITFEMPGFNPILLRDFYSDLPLDGKVTMEPLLWISETLAGNGTADGNLKYMRFGNHDDDMSYAPSVTVNFRYGLNNISGPILATTTTNAIGYWRQGLPSGYYTATVNATGYMPKSFPVVIWRKGGSSTVHSFMPDVSYDDIRIILFNVKGYDMELVVVEGPLQDSQQRTRVECQGTRLSADKLIHNDYAGANADSTVIKKQLPGTYRISVYVWYHRKGVQNWRLARSHSVVELYRGKNLWARYYAPNRYGNTWIVAELDGLNLTTINEITTVYHNT
ncbi:uncharacterized protein LOC129586048 [Paramacrobiotus metropolitanus]|uniref:uncharacterized protein LOC129586048 n=1 Tax=Paramacrobiotus metropolitanus TaxID=2943436 RepID=UPI0024462EA2|nr:uncharacterized protein LOC129586048 [Paramacrobiotus metropolitanus]